jgi:hypothetical protein
MKLKYLVLLLIVIASCKKAAKPKPIPSKTTLLTPSNNEICVNGIPVSTGKSNVSFEWITTDNTNSYDCILKNLETNETFTKNISTNKTTIELNTNTPYSWVITSINDNGKTESDKWKFYNSGDGIVSYAPFPAEVIFPAYDQVISSSNLKVNLSWKGLDVDNDIVGYDIYFGTVINPVIFKSDYKETSIADVDVIAKTKYYWRVITKDAKGNSSTSSRFQFSTN